MINKIQDNMIQTFKADLYDGHLIFDDEGQKALVDTGIHVTIGRNDLDFKTNTLDVV